MINEKHLVLTSHRKFLVLISNISGILLHRVLNHNERKKRMRIQKEKKGEGGGRQRKEGRWEGSSISSRFIHKEIPIGDICVQKNLIT